MLPVVKFLFIWILGILILPYVDLSLAHIIGLMALCSILFLCLHFMPDRSFKHLENGLLIGLVLCVVMVLNFKPYQEKDYGMYHYKTHQVLIEIKECHKQTNSQYTYIVELDALVNDSVYRLEAHCLLFQNRAIYSKHFYPGERFYASVYWKPILKAKHPALFNASKYWAAKGITECLWLQEGPLLPVEASTSFFYKIRRQQARWLELIQQQNITAPARELLSALVLGDKRGVSQTLRSRFSNLGLAHTLALSGLHIGLIYGVFAFLLRCIFKYKPRLQSLILVIIILFYALLTGLSPSVMRASFMFLLYAFALAVNRRTTPLNIVCVSALILLIYDANLLYDIGFQLSYMAVFGILYFYGFFKDFIADCSIVVKFILALAFVSLSAQLGTALLSVYYFHQFPLSFLWANVLVLPLVCCLLYAGVFYLFLLILGLQFDFVDAFVDGVVALLLRFLSFIEQYSFSAIELYISGYELFYAYGLLLLICLVFLEKKFKLLAFLYVYVLAGTVFYYCTKAAPIKALYINANKRCLLISVTSNNEQLLVTDEPEYASYLLGDYALMHDISCTDTLSLSSVYQNEFSSIEGARLAFFDRHLLVIDHEAVRKDFVLDVAVLVLRSFRNDVAVLNKQLSPSVVLLDPRIYRHHRNLLREKWEALHVNVIDLSDDVYTQSYD